MNNITAFFLKYQFCCLVNDKLTNSAVHLCINTHLVYMEKSFKLSLEH